MQTIHAIDRCPECHYSWTGLPPEGRCPECGFPYDSQLTVQWVSKTAMHLSIVVLVLNVVTNALLCYKHLARTGIVRAPPGSPTPFVMGIQWGEALFFGGLAAALAAVTVWACLLAREPWYVSFDGQGMRVRWGWRTRSAAWREIKRIDTSRWTFDYIVLSHGRRIRIRRSSDTKTYKEFLARANQELTRARQREAARESEHPSAVARRGPGESDSP